MPDLHDPPQDRTPGRQVRPRAHHDLHRRDKTGRSGNGSGVNSGGRCVPRVRLLQRPIGRFADRETPATSPSTSTRKKRLDAGGRDPHAPRRPSTCDRITKRFYDRFKTEHDAFLKFIEGITDRADARVVRLADAQPPDVRLLHSEERVSRRRPDYLRNRLQAVQERKGKDKFLTFYRYFLLRAVPRGPRRSPSSATRRTSRSLLGDVPYLNGGLFDVHELEQLHTPRSRFPTRPSSAFRFLRRTTSGTSTTRPLRDDNEINPDVLGYIFEKYINQKQMGAYYTKEDITDYIARNTDHSFPVRRRREEVRRRLRAGRQPSGGCFGTIPTATSTPPCEGRRR